MGEIGVDHFSEHEKGDDNLNKIIFTKKTKT